MVYIWSSTKKTKKKKIHRLEVAYLSLDVGGGDDSEEEEIGRVRIFYIRKIVYFTIFFSNATRFFSNASLEMEI